MDKMVFISTPDPACHLRIIHEMGKVKQRSTFNVNRLKIEKKMKTEFQDEENAHPQLYKTWGIISMPVLGSTMGRKHSSMIVRATASFRLHSAFRATKRCAE
ncbi:hypothetical protein Hanom_Chr16g01483381 [Helianthus anomalus]